MIDPIFAIIAAGTIVTLVVGTFMDCRSAQWLWAAVRGRRGRRGRR